MDILEPAKKGISLASKLAFIFGGAMIGLRLLRSRQAVDFKGRVVVISGGSRGLGLCIAREFAKEGAQLALLARDEDELKTAQQQLEAMGANVLTVVADVTDPHDDVAAIKRVIERFGSVDVLINNAGIIQVGPLEHMLDSDFKAAIDLHIWAPLRLSRAALPYLKRSGQGRIVNIASSGGLIAMPHMAPYAVSKFGMVGLSDAMRNELAKDKVKVTTVCPGPIRTGSHVAAKFKGQQAKEYKMFKTAAIIPGGSVNAVSAARMILDAARYGDPQLAFPLPIFWGSILYRLFPNVAGEVLGYVSRFLPGPTEGDAGNKTLVGAALEAQVATGKLTASVDKAAAQNNELGGDVLGQTTKSWFSVSEDFTFFPHPHPLP